MSQAEAAFIRPPPAKTTLLFGEQTAGSLLANIFRVYRHHFGVIFWCCLLPLFPVVLLLQVLQTQGPGWGALALLPYMAVLFIISGALTVALSDICVGNRPTVRRSYSRIFLHKRWWYLLSTTLVLTLALYLGLLLLVVPGMWLSIRALFTSTVVTLEGRRNRDAIRRSLQLTKGQFWRIFGLLMLPALIAEALTIVLVVVLAIGVSLLALGTGLAAQVMATLIYLVAIGIFLPAIGLTTVLLYYDQRVRREAYDPHALSEDLMR